MKTLRILVLSGMFSLIANSQSYAAPLLLNANGLADLNGSPLDVTYNSTSGSFQVNGDLADYVDISGADVGGYSGYGGYSVSATIDKTTGLLAPGGTISITGYIGPDYSTSEPLLTGNLESGLSGLVWGYDDNSSVDQFTFLFTVTGGNVASDFGGIGNVCGVNLFAEFSSHSGHDTPFTGTWGGSFNNLNNSQAGTGAGYADIFPVPEPSSILLVSAGVLCMVVRRRLNAPRA